MRRRHRVAALACAVGLVGGGCAQLAGIDPPNEVAPPGEAGANDAADAADAAPKDARGPSADADADAFETDGDAQLDALSSSDGPSEATNEAGPFCGDGVVDGNEQCDFGAANGVGTGCETTCKFSCEKIPADTCVTADLCKGTNACAAVAVSGHAGQKCVLGAPPPDGTACPNGGTCAHGVCTTATCGNGTVDPGEQCDWGASNAAGVGCEKDCQFSCEKTPSDTCPSADPCTAAPQKCSAVSGPGSAPGQKCQPAAPLAACAACGGALNICVNNACTPNRCGDRCVDTAAGEVCDPPNGTTCGPTCKPIVCGDGKREGAEQCDDANTTSLDGCDASCRFEQDQRANTFTIQGSVSSFCSLNAFGAAMSATARQSFQASLTNGVATGATTLLLKFMNLGDPTGTSNQTALVLGSFAGTPVAGAGYNGANDVDWWYTSNPADLDGSRAPRSQPQGALAGAALTASGPFDFTMSLGGATTHAHMWGTKLRATIGSASSPMSSSGTTPGHRAVEQLDPALVSFGSMSAGELCGGLTAATLAGTPIPASLAAGGANACTEGYPATASMLDVFVYGCHGPFGITLVTAVGPDMTDPSVSLPGTPPYHLAPASGPRVTSCNDKNGTTVDLQACLAALSYSSYFGFTSDRVIAK